MITIAWYLLGLVVTMVVLHVIIPPASDNEHIGTLLASFCWPIAWPMAGVIMIFLGLFHFSQWLGTTLDRWRTPR